MHLKQFIPILLAATCAACTTATVAPDSGPERAAAAVTATRTLQEIQEAFDRNKGGFIAIYNRAAKRNKKLANGRVVFDITFEPDGSVSAVNLVSSTFTDADFETALAQRIMSLKLAPKDVPVFVCRHYPFDFVPIPPST